MHTLSLNEGELILVEQSYFKRSNLKSYGNPFVHEIETPTILHRFQDFEMKGEPLKIGRVVVEVVVE